MSSSVKFGGRSPVVADYFTRSLGVCVEDEAESLTRASKFVWKYSPLSECCIDNLFWHAATTVDTVIPCSNTLADRPLSLLPFPIEGRGQPLFSLESTSSHTDQAQIDEDSEEAIFAVQNTGSTAVKGNGILHTLFLLALLILCPFPLLSARNRLLPSRLSDPLS